jgi:hypothetical protein
MLITITELIENSLENYFVNFKKILAPIAILLGSVFLRYFIGITGLILTVNTRLSSMVVDSISLLLIIIINLISLLASIIITRRLKQIHYKEDQNNLKSDLLEAKKVFLPFILVSFLYALICMVGSILFIIPGIIFFGWYFFSSYSLLLDDTTIMGSFRASKALTENRWWSMVFRIVIPKIIFIIAVVILEMLVSGIFEYLFPLSMVKYEILDQFVKSTFSALLLPLVVQSDLLLYFSAKENITKN